MASRKRAARPKATAVRERALTPFETRRLLLDTHAFLWWLADSPRLGARARRAIAHAGEVWVSAATVWEISIKMSLGKLELPRDADIEAELVNQGFRALPIDVPHAMAAGALPNHHRDPFDRMLVAQAQVEGLTIVTADDSIPVYGGRVLSALD